MGAAPDAQSSDFRVLVGIKRNDGLRGAAEEASDTTDARSESKDPEDAVPGYRGDETGKPELPRARTGPEERSSQQETSAFCHVPGGMWRNKYTWESTPSQRRPRGEPTKNNERGIKGESTPKQQTTILNKALNKYHLHLK
ncbi:hypothetical protein NDU88_003896 [Pleurodeles waltl]|uniref:Uncharacterized protein n=1 Tax=Pleurodeles waltl TaxID=8319 RepID=A0AAV7M6Q3_PLEWA|nr:hypothetical protein NDU88_003896 [Pleurodeles waltl]